MTRPFTLLEVPYDSGRRGERHGAGPGALVDDAVVRLGVHGAAVERVGVDLPDEFGIEAERGTEVMRRIAREVTARPAGVPVALAGNCGATLGVVAGLRAADPGRRVAVLWFDAHGDLQTPTTSTSGFFDGMGLAMLTGRCWQALAATVPGHAVVPDERVALVGGHDLDDAERELLARSALTWVSVADVRAQGPAERALDQVLARCDAVHVHVDLDVHDASVAPANSYAVPGGLLPHEVRRTVAAAVARAPLASATLASWDPTLDVGDHVRGTALALLDLLAELAG